MMKILKVLLLLCVFSTKSYCSIFITAWESKGTSSNPDTLDFKVRTNSDTVFWYLWYLNSDDSKINNVPDTFNFVRSTSASIIYLTNVKHTGKILLEIESKNLTQFSVEITSLQKIREIKKWGSAKWIDMTAAFRNCSNLQLTATDIPDLSNVKSLKEMFDGCINFTGGNIGNWNVSNVTTMERMFANAENFNADISDWDVSNVDDMFNMFFHAKRFNQDLSGWCMSRILTEPQGFHAGTTNWYKLDREPCWGRCAVWIGPNSSSDNLFSNTENWLAGQLPDSLTMFILISPVAKKDMRLERNLTSNGNSINYNLSNIIFKNRNVKVILGNFHLRLNNFSGEKFWKFKTDSDGTLSIKVRKNESVRFDVGNSSYNPVTVKNNDSANFFDVSVYDFVLNNGLSGSQINGVPHVNRTWKILNNSSIVDGANFIFEWNINEEVEGLSSGGFENAYLNTIDTSMNNWELARTGSGTYSTGDQFLNHDGYKSYFYLFAIGASAAPLPQQYIFNATKITHPKNTVLLEWHFNEIDVKFVEVLRKTDSNWEVISYSSGEFFLDDDPKIHNVYKIKATTFQEEIHYTSVLYVVFQKSSDHIIRGSDIIISPNPNNGDFTLKLPRKFDAKYSIYDSTNRLVKSGPVHESVNINLSSSGFYYCIIMIDDKYFKKKILIH